MPFFPRLLRAASVDPASLWNHITINDRGKRSFSVEKIKELNVVSSPIICRLSSQNAFTFPLSLYLFRNQRFPINDNREHGADAEKIGKQESGQKNVDSNPRL